MCPIYFDRRVPDALVKVLAPGGALHGLAEIAADPKSLVDLRPRAYPDSKSSHATLYVNLTKVLDVVHHSGKGVRFLPGAAKKPPEAFDDTWKVWRDADELTAIADAVVAYVPQAVAALAPRFVKTNGEGYLQTQLAKRASKLMIPIDREAVPGFSTKGERAAAILACAAPVKAAVADLDGGAFGKLKSLGSEADLLAVDTNGRLLVIEVKGATAKAGICWAPAQVSVYAALFRLWQIERGAAHAHAVLAGMVAQHCEMLGVAADILAGPPTMIVPVVAIEMPPSPAALAGLKEVRKRLVGVQPGHPDVEEWLVAPDGAITEVDP
jgi:hypothetical protein